ncbi:MAG: hypothetical protein C6W57_07165 [Caldibacillus debilis]|nr:MAG: hypothetical protein C6W57_07165 [Caldibacillus debilis]REJ28446.1 MAG: hypothetical protein C6W56_08255 [Caldibacillus debilis]
MTRGKGPSLRDAGVHLDRKQENYLAPLPKNPESGVRRGFFYFGNGAGGRSFANTKRSGRIWQGMGRAGPDKGTRHQFETLAALMQTRTKGSARFCSTCWLSINRSGAEKADRKRGTVKAERRTMARERNALISSRRNSPFLQSGAKAGGPAGAWPVFPIPPAQDPLRF